MLFQKQKRFLEKSGALFEDPDCVEFEIGNSHTFVKNPRTTRNGDAIENDTTSFVRFKNPALKN